MVKTDNELIDRAQAAGWVWTENSSDTWPGSKEYPVTGWLREQGSFQHCTVETKIDILRGAGYASGHLGFDHDHDCVFCGKPLWLGWSTEVEKEMVARSLCWDCLFWIHLVEVDVEDPDSAVVVERDGKRIHYRICPEGGTGNFRGFGGSKFTVVFAGEYGAEIRKVVTRNLWRQGEIPEAYWDLFPVNATFESSSGKVEA